MHHFIRLIFCILFHGFLSLEFEGSLFNFPFALIEHFLKSWKNLTNVQLELYKWMLDWLLAINPNKRLIALYMCPALDKFLYHALIKLSLVKLLYIVFLNRLS